MSSCVLRQNNFSCLRSSSGSSSAPSVYGHCLWHSLPNCSHHRGKIRSSPRSTLKKNPSWRGIDFQEFLSALEYSCRRLPPIILSVRVVAEWFVLGLFEPRFEQSFGRGPVRLRPRCSAETRSTSHECSCAWLGAPIHFAGSAVPPGWPTMFIYAMPSDGTQICSSRSWLGIHLKVMLV